jgi:hypothetical protein
LLFSLLLDVFCTIIIVSGGFILLIVILLCVGGWR